MNPFLTTNGSIRIAPASGQAPEIFIAVLHGVGASAHAMEPVAQALASGLPTAAVVALNGYDPFDMGGNGRQWFSVNGITKDNRSTRVEAAMPRIDAAIAKEEDRLGLTRRQTVLLGFSQGSILAMHMAATSANPPRAVVALSGRVAGHLHAAPQPRPAVLLSHGTLDSVIPIAEMDVAAEALVKAGCPVQMLRIPGLGHSVHPQQIERALEFYSDVMDVSIRRSSIF
jgi:phospholipase/carboxylesterase